MESKSSANIAVRRALPEDSARCGEICFRAFSAINAEHNFPCDFPSVEMATDAITAIFSTPGLYCVVAETEGGVIGSNCLDERGPIHGVGPITIDPEIQNRGVGRILMRALMDRSREDGAVGIRLVQAAFHNRSLSLYTLLGFDVREPLSCLQGRIRAQTIPGCIVRPATLDDLEACNAVARRVHGFERSADLSAAVTRGTARVVERSGRITGYTTHLGFYGHSTAETNVDLQALIAAAESLAGPGILVPSRNAALFRWCIENGLRVVQPMTLMSTGLYNEPAGASLPSILF
ncbi:MAG: GNAT family N-acetyltransferase [Terracidiphilus sp.]